MRHSIDDRFIEVWHPRYDGTECDEAEYSRILDGVGGEMRTTGRISAESFFDILHWKWAGLTGKIHRNAYGSYLDAIADCYGPTKTPMERMKVLDGLWMVGPPLASTILHFVDPKSFPIYDVRTVAVLKLREEIENRTPAFSHYKRFMEVILSVKRNCSKSWTLRQIDRALFAFHKQNPGLFQK